MESAKAEAARITEEARSKFSEREAALSVGESNLAIGEKKLAKWEEGLVGREEIARQDLDRAAKIRFTYEQAIERLKVAISDELEAL